MVNDINNNLASSLLNGSLSSKDVAGVTNVLKNAYGANTQSSDLVDESKISKEAFAKYQAEQEISYYKKLMSAMLGTEEDDSTSKITDLIREIKSNNKATVSSNSMSKDLLSSLDSGTSASDIIEKVKSGDYKLTDAELATAILSDSFATSLLG